MASHGKISSQSPCFFRIIMPQILENGTLASSYPLHFFPCVNKDSKNCIQLMFSLSVHVQVSSFKCLLSYTFLQELPRKFTKKHWKDFSSHAYLEVPTGAKSKMKMKKKSNGRAQLHKGWQEFVEKYSIKNGYFLVFRYQGRSNFSVQIFNLSTEEIEYVKTSQKEEVDLDIKEEQCDDYLDDSSNSRKFQRAKAVRSRNPHFSVTMKPAYVTNRDRGCYMHIPKKATSFFHAKGKGDVFLSLKEENGRVWSMKYCVGPPPKYIARFGSGWRDFSEENNLKEGDRCTFELVSSVNMRFKVTISRKNNPEVGQRRKRDSSVIADLVSSQGKLRSGQNSSSVEKNSPSFSVIMKQAYVSRISYMYIPKSGRIFFHNKGEDDIFLSLKGENGKFWPLKYYVGSPPSCLARMSSGWGNFWKENNLKEGDICTFEPVSSMDMIFKVTISRETDEHVDKRRKKSSPVIPDVVSPPAPGTKRKSLVKEESAAIECNETCFTVTMRKEQVQDSCRLNIPRAHSAKHLLDQHGNVIFLHLLGKTWRMKCKIYGLDARLMHGWKDFVVDNDLQEGDTCVFELFREKPNHYKIAIFSGAGSSSRN